MGEIKRFFGPKRTEADFEDLQDLFTLLFRSVPDTVYVLDGLDFLDQNHCRSLLKLFRSLFSGGGPLNGSRILLLSREQLPGYRDIAAFIPSIRQISTSSNVMRDIEVYIETSISDKMVCRKLTKDPKLLDEVREVLLTVIRDVRN